MPAGPRKPVERHNGRVYWPTRDVAVGFVDFFHAPGRILGTQTFRAAGGFSGFYHFSGGQGFAFYLHTLRDDSETKLRKMTFKLNLPKISALRARFFLGNP